MGFQEATEIVVGQHGVLNFVNKVACIIVHELHFLGGINKNLNLILTVEDKIFLRKRDNMKKRILTGLKPTGELTLGNYIGAISQMVEL